MASPALTRTLVTDTVPHFRLPPALVGAQVEVVGAAPLFAAAGSGDLPQDADRLGFQPGEVGGQV